MVSRISFFDRGIFRNYLKRLWPLWLGYLAVMVLILPVELASQPQSDYNIMEFNRYILQSGISSVYVSIVVAPIAAMAVFSYLYNSRSCGMMNSLPVRRETMFSTCYLTGLLPMLLADVLIFAISALIYAPREYIGFSYLLQWLALAVMGNIAFFSMAVFCAVLTGNILILPAVYAVLNVAVDVFESGVRALLGDIVYGYTYEGNVFSFLSPAVKIDQALNVNRDTEIINGVVKNISGSFHMDGMFTLLAYCLVGLALVVAAMFIYRERHMESAGDVVAVKLLRPVFRYCMCFGGAVVFAAVVFSWIFQRSSSGVNAAVICLVLMLLGGAVGYYIAEILMQKTIKVFKGSIKGLAPALLIIIVGLLVFELDLFGYETRMPDRDQIKSVQISYQNNQFESPECIDSYLKLHETLISNKERNESAENFNYMDLCYVLNDGSRFQRRFRVDRSRTTVDQPGSEYQLMQKLINLPEVRQRRVTLDIPLTEESYSRGVITCQIYDGIYDYYWEDVARLDYEQARELYYDCILPDVADGTLGVSWYYTSMEYFETSTDTDINLDVTNWDYKDGDPGSKYDSVGLNVTVDAHRTIAWLEENLGISPTSLIDNGRPYEDELSEQVYY